MATEERAGVLEVMVEKEVMEVMEVVMEVMEVMEVVMARPTCRAARHVDRT